MPLFCTKFALYATLTQPICLVCHSHSTKCLVCHSHSTRVPCMPLSLNQMPCMPPSLNPCALYATHLSYTHICVVYNKNCGSVENMDAKTAGQLISEKSIDCWKNRPASELFDLTNDSEEDK